MKTVLVIVLLLLTGCAEFSAVKTGIASHGAQAADEALDVAEWGVCEAVTMGAWQRKYGMDAAKVEGWKRLCEKAVATP
jgi:hypothetical protein